MFQHAAELLRHKPFTNLRAECSVRQTLNGERLRIKHTPHSERHIESQPRLGQ